MNAGTAIQERYELTALLGRGGMAEVWQATDPHLGRHVGVKFLAPQLSEDPEFLVRFFAEAQAVARINHPNVVRILDFGEYEESPYLVMECVTGGTLADRIGEPHEPGWAFEVIAQTARAAGAAHALGIVHRDIKPGNILLDNHGVAKLADFGIASSARSERLTSTGAAIGSPHYISPEQASGKNSTPASDVYALGIVSYEMLTGIRPFEGDNVTAVAIAHVEKDPAPPSTHVPELSEAIDALVLRCLAKDPEARFANGTELATALERLDESDAALVVGDRADVGGMRWSSRRTMTLAGLVATALIAIPVIGVLASGDGPETADAEERAEQAPLPNVGGLGLSKSLKPIATAAVTTPTSKAELIAEKKRKANEPTTDSGTGTDREEDPAPTPEPTQAEPTPEPTGSPAP